MKTRKLNLLLVFLLLLPLGVVLLGTGCKKEETRDDNLVVKEFPILYMGYNLKPEKTVIIRDQETFDKVFSKELVTQCRTLTSSSTMYLSAKIFIQEALLS